MSSDDKWMAQFKKLSKMQRNGVNINTKIDVADIESWRLRQKNKYSKGELSQSQIDLLVSIGFVLESKGNNKNLWEQSFKILEEIYNAGGDVNALSCDSAINTWKRNQRTAYCKCTLSKKSENLLRSIGFAFNEPIE